MKKIGLLGGLTWHSTLQYYQLINQNVDSADGALNGADILLRSLRFDKIQPLIENGHRREIAKIIDQEFASLSDCGTEIFAIACNSVHNSLEYSNFVHENSQKFIHITDEPLRLAIEKRISRVGLLSTKHSLEFWQERGRKLDVTIITPDHADMDRLNSYIFSDLIHGRVEPKAQIYFGQICHDLIESGAEAIILGCTELFLFDRLPGVQFLDTTALHAKRIAEEAIAMKVRE